MPIKPKYLRILNLNTPVSLTHKSFVSAASGLALINNELYCIADDLNTLTRFTLNTTRPGEIIELGLDALPNEKAELKKNKPDFESILKISEDSLGLIPSGSGEKRTTGVFYNRQKTFHFNLHPLFSKLKEDIPELNLEGAVNTGEELILFQRGNGINAQNAIIQIDLAIFLKELQQERTITPNTLISVSDISLPKLNGIHLSFTDACYHNNQIYFLAAAEDSKSTWDDGLFAGAALGKMTSTGALIGLQELLIDHKPEGLEFAVNLNKFLICTDSDNPDTAANLYEISADNL